MSLRRVLPALLMGVASVAAIGCGSSSSPSTTSSSAPPPTTSTPASAPPAASGGSTVNVTYQNIAISPAAVTVKVGTTVRWTNQDSGGVVHNVVSEGGPQAFSSASLNQGATYSFKFTKVGAYKYECSFHPASMQGTVTVVK